MDKGVHSKTFFTISTFLLEHSFMAKSWGPIGLLDFSVRPSPNWTLDFNCFGFGIGIRSKDTGLGTGA